MLEGALMPATAPEPMLAFDPPEVGGPRYLARVFPSLLGRNARVWMSFRISLVMDLLKLVAQASIFFFVGQALGTGGQAWTGNYAAFLTIGLVFNTLLEASLTGPYSSLSQNYWSARLETVLLSPSPVWSLLVADSIWFYVRAAVNAVILGIVGWQFGARLDASFGDVALSVLALLVCAVAVLGFGLMSASMFMLVNAKGFNDPIGWLVMLLQGLVTGAYFPVGELPHFLQILAKCLPQTYAIDLARRLLLPESESAALLQIGSLTPIQADLAMLAMFVITIPLLGAWCFRAGLRKAQIDGGLSRWA
jgi:ABC-type polysaccharide/polyol phosphate export permease